MRPLSRTSSTRGSSIHANFFIGQTLAETYLGLRRFPEAERTLDDLVLRNPESAAFYRRHKAFLHVFWTGDTTLARTVLDVAERIQPRARHLPHARFLLAFYQRDLRTASRLADSGNLRFDLTGGQDDVYNVQADLTRAIIYRLMSRTDAARPLFEVVRAKVLAAPERPTPGGKHLYLAQAYAGLGLRADALREAGLAEQSLQHAADEWERGHFTEMLLHVYVMTGDHDRAIDRIERLLSWEYYEGLTIPELRLDPSWDSLRSHPRFLALLQARSVADMPSA